MPSEMKVRFNQLQRQITLIETIPNAKGTPENRNQSYYLGGIFVYQKHNNIGHFIICIPHENDKITFYDDLKNQSYTRNMQLYENSEFIHILLYVRGDNPF